jgi:hypothetical protein
LEQLSFELTIKEEGFGAFPERLNQEKDVNGCSEHLSSGLVDNLGERSEVVKGVEA